MRKAQFFYLLRRGLLSGGLNLIKEGLVMASKFTTQGLSFPAQGSALFNGSSDYITAPVLDEYNAITIGGWAYSNNAGLYQIPFGNLGETSTDGVGLTFKFRNNGQIWVVIGNTSSTGNSFNSSVYGTYTANKWTYISATYNKTSCSLYQDGSLLGSFNYSQSTLKSETPFQIGVGYVAPASFSEYFNGNLANVAIWNRALSSDEINSVMWKSYEALSGTESNGLQAWYSLDDITSPAASLANMQQLATDKNATIENTAAITAAINSLS